MAEAKKEGETLTGVAWQTAKYLDGLPNELATAVDSRSPVPDGASSSRGYEAGTQAGRH